MPGSGYERKSQPIRSTSALPAIADLREIMSVFDLLTNGSAQEADNQPTEANARVSPKLVGSLH
jgi:hypothetical protein